MEWMLMPYRRYADFSGRSRRKEYWMFVLLNVLIAIVLEGLTFALGASAIFGLGAQPATALSFGPMFWIAAILLGIWALVTIIPSLAVAVRRLHDRDMSGWYLLGFVIVIAIISRFGTFGRLLTLVLEVGYIVILALPGTVGPNKYGPDPLGQTDPEVFA